MLEGGHDGYARLDPPVQVFRRFELRHEAAELRIRDRLEGAGEHTVEFFFHAAPGAAGFQEEGLVGFRWGDGAAVTLKRESEMALEGEFRDGWFSPSYGVKQERPVWVAEVRARMPLDVSWHLAFHRAGDLAVDSTDRRSSRGRE